MRSLNELYNKFCKPKYKSYKQVSNNITLIDNFFDNFESARDFFLNREKWSCTNYRGYSKPGYETIFPDWVGKSLLEKYIHDHNISMEITYTTCDFRYNEKPYNLTSSDLYPHIDSVSDNDSFICLINLNKIPVSTKFYSFEDKIFCNMENKEQWAANSKNLNKQFLQFCNGDKNSISHKKIKEFLNCNRDKLKVNLLEEVIYSPNQSIVYPSNMFHHAHVPEDFTKNNPRSLLRIIFWILPSDDSRNKILSRMNIFKYH